MKLNNIERKWCKRTIIILLVAFILLVCFQLMFGNKQRKEEELYIRYIPTTQKMREEHIIDSNGDTAWAVYTIKVQKHYTKTKQIY